MQEGRLVRVLEERKSQLVGRFFLEHGYAYVVPDDSRITQDILIPNEHRGGARMGNVVVMEITDRGARTRGMTGKVVEVLGENMAASASTFGSILAICTLFIISICFTPLSLAFLNKRYRSPIWPSLVATMIFVIFLWAMLFFSQISYTSGLPSMHKFAFKLPGL